MSEQRRVIPIQPREAASAVSTQPREPASSAKPATRPGYGVSQPVRSPNDRRQAPRHVQQDPRPGALGLAIDPHTREGRFIVNYEKMLIEHRDDRPSITQKMLITAPSVSRCILSCSTPPSSRPGKH